MASYLLLRSNKQSGPYTLDELCALGLKPYDLIWAEGRSAAWRYPSEIDELKDFAPTVEEQPYDRFYKKTSGEKHYHETVTEVQPEIKKAEPLLINKTPDEQVSPVPLFEEKKEKKTEAPVIVMQTRPTEQILKPIQTDEEKQVVKQQVELPKKLKVFVSLPKTEKTFSPPASQAATTQQATPVPVSQSPVQKSAELPAQSKVVNETPVEKHELKEEYSRPLDEIKKMYVETYLNDKKKRSERKKKLIVYARYAAVAIFIIVLGTFVYSAIRMDKNTDTLFADQNSNQQSKEVPKLNSSKKVVVTPQREEPQEPLIDDVQESSGELKTVAKPKTKQQETAEQNETILPEDEQVTTEEMTTSDARPSRITKPINLAEHVTVKANDYKRKAFGGIHGLQLTVHNDSKYVIDKVMVELQFLKPSEEPLKSEIYYFNSIAPNGSLTIKIPDNPRGIKVAYKITHIVSNQYDQDIAGL